MNKTVVLVVSGDGDYGAMTFGQNFNPQEVYEQMVAEGVTRKTVVYDDPTYGEEDLYCKICEFEAVDPAFFSFLVNEGLIDEDTLKYKDVHFVEVKGE